MLPMSSACTVGYYVRKHFMSFSFIFHTLSSRACVRVLYNLKQSEIIFAIQVRECVSSCHHYVRPKILYIGPMQNLMNTSIEHVILCYFFFSVLLHTFLFLLSCIYYMPHVDIVNEFNSFELYRTASIQLNIQLNTKERKILPASLYITWLHPISLLFIHFLHSRCCIF